MSISACRVSSPSVRFGKKNGERKKKKKEKNKETLQAAGERVEKERTKGVVVERRSEVFTY